MHAHPDLADRLARALTLVASAYLFVRIGMGLLPV
jgi:2-oxo-4-hydroxy-4-carboxy--5-ureidoimidazoline (OHCU) decarboxylase